ncbi:hypothetical protein ANN_05806 [Periplaneta americana]|uniref:Uncharacterized protein n=1 Tax=Periplaneta americana TaxID=6978 RepID=A0ABQ8TDX3_PERAM|nr:hypothetical protein ANN_05806 [Periplaneta americana]
MEPLPENTTGGLAPILGWSNDSPSLSPAMTPKTPADTSDTPPKSVTSSGIGPDSPSRTVSFSSNDFSSIGYEPQAVCPTLSSSDSRRSPKPNGSSTVPPPLKNGHISREKPQIETVITDNPSYDSAAVKFQEVSGASEVDSICSSTQTSDDDEEGGKVPDGGWGWVVVFASLVISMVADGISFSFGLLYIEFLNHFGESKSKTAWIGSLFMAVPLLSGPVGSALVDRYGCRTMTIIGGLVSGTGFIMSAFVNNIELMYTTFGVIAGMGLGFCYVTAVVCIAYWFDKKRALATGLGACGTGIGTFVYAPMTQFFIEEYGWRGTILLLAGTLLNMCVCGALMRDPEWWSQEQKKSSSLTGGNKSVKGTSSCGSISGRSALDSDFPGVEEIRKMLKGEKKQEYMLTTLAGNTIVPPQVAPQEGGMNHDATSRSVVNLPTYIREKEKVPLEVLESLRANKRMYNVILENYPSLLLCRSISDHGKLNSIINDNFVIPAARVPVTTIKATKHSPCEVVGFTDDLANTPLLEKRSEGDQKAIAITTRSPKSSIKRHKSTPPDRMDSFKKHISAPTQGSPHYLKNIRVHSVGARINEMDKAADPCTVVLGYIWMNADKLKSEIVTSIESISVAYFVFISY